jgi:UDP-N-acetyl-D-galactosamine dehydrogenase
MGLWVADELHARRGQPGTALVMGLAFKENVPDLRNSRVIDVIRRLTALGHHVTVHDPLAHPGEAQHEYDVDLDPGALQRSYDLVVLAVPHDAYSRLSDDDISSLVEPGGLMADLKNLYVSRRLPATLGRWTL